MDEKDWLLLEPIDRVGIRAEARWDAYRRGIEHFQDHAFDAIAAHDFYHTTLRCQAPHFWSPSSGRGGSTPQPNTAAATSALGPASQEKRALTPAELQHVNSIKNPIERLTKLRELEQKPL